VEKDAPFASNKTKNTITQIEILPLADSSHPHILLQLMKKLNSTLFAAALMLSPATTSAQSDTADNEKKEAKKADQEVVVEANDQMQFNKKAFEIQAGDTIKLTLKHVGKLPKIAMGHNLVILQKGTNLAGWASKARPLRKLLLPKLRFLAVARPTRSLSALKKLVSINIFAAFLDTSL
jgi:plastocyanin